MPSMENRVSRLEEYRDNRKTSDERMIDLMQEIQEDVHSLKIKMEKKISFVGGMAFTCTLIGSAAGSIAGIIARKAGIA